MQVLNFIRSSGALYAKKGYDPSGHSRTLCKSSRGASGPRMPSFSKGATIFLAATVALVCIWHVLPAEEMDSYVFQ